MKGAKKKYRLNNSIYTKLQKMQANLKMTEGSLVMIAWGFERWEPWSIRREGKGSRQLQKGRRKLSGAGNRFLILIALTVSL